MPFLKSSASSSYQEKEKIRLNIVIIFLVALALVVSAIFILPNLAPNVTLTVPDVASIVFDGGVISLDADLTKVYVKVMYSDGTSKQVALSEMVSSGLDTTKEGKQNVSINFGGFVQNIDIEVVATDCLLTYVASVGGSIIGETTQRVPAGGNATTVIAVPEVGYKFVGWGDGYPDATRQDKSVSIDDEIKANFKKLEYTVIFYYPDGTTAREVLVQYNSYADAPRTDSKEMQKYGYKFVKWSEDFSKITKDTKIYPIYEKFATDIDFTFGLGIDGNPLGTSTNLKPYYAKGEIGSITVTPNTYRKFDSWSILNYEKKWIKIMPKTPSGDTVEVVTGELITFSSKIAEGKLEEEGIYTLSFVPKSTVDKITIVANFVYETSDIIFSSFDRIEATIPLKLGTAIGEHILLVPKAVTGYTFKYWYAKNGGMQDGKPIPVKETDLFTKPTEIIAYWTKDIQTAVFLKGETDGNLNEFTNNPTYDEQSGGIKLSVYFQDSLGSAISGKFPSFLPIKKLYDFAGWYLANADGVISQTVIDNNYKVVDKITYIAPKFVVKNRTVDVKFSGAGEIKYGLENGDLSVLNNFKFNIDADKSYKFQATEAQGYMIGKISYKVGEEINTSTSNEFVIAKLDIDASNITNIEINVSFVIKEYNLTINNGTVGAAKGMIYDDGKLLNFGDSNSITIKISHNVSKHINIMAPEGYYINSVLVNSSEKIIPEKAFCFESSCECIII